ncbi:MAG: hypothetical protein QOE36_3396 [Gaiellaceae bacterium]|nr:hypothetical protein [Gaiellaceae bacterium]
MPLALRIVVGLAGAVGIAIGVSALTKLRQSTLDSPRWMFVLFGVAAIAAGLGLLWSALVAFRRR